ncbi:MAG: hypothetical protein JKX71_00410 [Amylibacter sp.]|nr:hypothetical protein [Amylibacter sp.]
MLKNDIFRAEKAGKACFGGSKASYWAVFYHFQENFALSACFLQAKAAKLQLFQVLTGLARNKIRIAICQKQLHLSRYFWSLDCLHVQILHLLQVQHLSQNPSRHLCQHKNTKNYSQEPITVLGIPQMRTCGGVS